MPGGRTRWLTLVLPRGGGVADVVPAPGRSVRGALCRLTPAQVDRLDAYERGYARTPVRVTLSGAHNLAPAPRSPPSLQKPPSLHQAAP